MVLTNAQTTTFFETEMGIPPATVTQLQTMGIANVEDLRDYDKDLIKNVKEDLRKPTGTMPDPNDPTRVVAQSPFVLSPVSCKRLETAAHAVRYYEDTNRGISLAMMRWAGPLTLFKQYLTALESMKKDDKPDVPKVTRSLPIGQWSEAFIIHLEKTLGVRDIPMSYLVRPDVAVPAAAPALQAGRPYSDVHGSIVNELVARASHAHTLYDTDNEDLFNLIEEALRGTQYAATLSPFKRRKNGRGAYFAVIAQYVGKDKWLKEVKKQEQFLHNFVWKGNSNLTLESFVNKHRTASVRISQCAEHITYTVPSEEQRVRYLLDGIKTDNAQLLAGIGHVKADDGPTGKLQNFEDMVAYLIPFCPVNAKTDRKRKNGPSYDIAAVGGDLGTTKGSKTGVEVRFYKPHEYRQLSEEQKMELKELRSSNKSGKKRKGGKDGKGKENEGRSTFNKKKEKMLDKMIAAFEASSSTEDEKILDKQFDERIVAALGRVSASSVDNQNISALQSNLPPTPTGPPPQSPAEKMRVLKSIMSRGGKA
jgi:hypothetical protein